MMILFIGLAVLFALMMIVLYNSVYLVREAEVIVIERFGRYDRILLPGLHFVMPLFEAPRVVIWTYVMLLDNKKYHRYIKRTYRIDLREAVYDFPRQNVITKDNVTMEINALLYYQITDPKAAVYEASDLADAIEKLTQTTLRDVIGSMELDQSLTSRGHINERLRLMLDEATDKWGVKINRVELQEVNPPADIRHAMEKQMRAERDRRAIILESEGTKRAAILEAEGFKESKILRAQGESEAEIARAEGQSQARLKLAEAEAEAIKMISSAYPQSDAMAYLVAMQYVKALPTLMEGKNDKLIVVPYEAAGFTGSLVSMKKILDVVGQQQNS